MRCLVGRTTISDCKSISKTSSSTQESSVTAAFLSQQVALVVEQPDMYNIGLSDRRMCKILHMALHQPAGWSSSAPEAASVVHPIRQKTKIDSMPKTIAFQIEI